MENLSMRDLILDAAEELVQLHGFNAFSYRDVAAMVGIRSASIHYHFPKKDDLALALFRRYHTRLTEILQGICQRDVRPEIRLEQYIELFSTLSAEGTRLCLFAVFSAEASSLSEEVQREICSFYHTNIDWISGVIEEGKRKGVFGFSGLSGEVARGIFALLEGEILLKHAFRSSMSSPSVPPSLRSLLSWPENGPSP